MVKVIFDQGTEPLSRAVRLGPYRSVQVAPGGEMWAMTDGLEPLVIAVQAHDRSGWSLVGDFEEKWWRNAVVVGGDAG